ncbi:MAG: hypothetical protein NTW21_16545 [Verrucomicrobia bacterium]|nr:hypothetical protein [Verrucomicrobiota bacterium]
MKQPTFTTLAQVPAALAAEKARPGAFRNALAAAIAAEQVTIQQLEAALDPAGIAALATAQTKLDALTTRLSDFDRFPLENWQRQLADALCQTHAATIAGLFEAQLALAERKAPGVFEKLAEKLAALARKAIGRNLSPEDVRLVAVESDRVQGEADALNYSLSVAQSGIANFKAAPGEETFNSANSAIRAAADFS